MLSCWGVRQAHRFVLVAAVLGGGLLDPCSARGQALAAVPRDTTDAVFPGAEWQTATPESMGFSSARLEGLRAWLKAGPTTSMMVVVKGRVIFSYGDTAKVSVIASCRKSVLAMLMGKYVMSGKLNFGKTVEELGLQEKTPFLPVEKSATLEELMEGRSGIYMPEDGPYLDGTEPQRGALPPGLEFWYDNWEFDAAGTAFERETGRNIYDALQTDLAEPLGMQDFRRDIQKKDPDPHSVHPIYHMRLSTRDVARLGLLMEQHGKWNGKVLIDENWVGFMTTPLTSWAEMNPTAARDPGLPERWGFGMGWWVWDARPFPANRWFSNAPFRGAYEAQGTGGQYLMVLPAHEIVIVHKLDLETHNEKDWVTPQEWDAMTNMVIAAMCHGPCSATK